MKTCPSCRCDDIPDQATHCRHCGRRIGRHPALIPILIIVAIVLIGWPLIAALHAADERDAARSRARIEIKSLEGFHCTPDIAGEFESIGTKKFDEELAASPLDIDDRQMLEVGFSNAMELAGCGPGAIRAQAIAARAAARASAKAAAVSAARSKIVLSFVTQPDECNIYIDNRMKGTSPLDVEVTPGDHTWIADKAGYKQQWDSITLTPGERRTITVSLKSLF